MKDACDVAVVNGRFAFVRAAFHRALTRSIFRPNPN
jgi:hypothetical protein